jgi:uncharacterized protein (TIGR02118 family)
MIRVTVFYPNSEGARFDMAYYTSKHLPMAKSKSGCVSMSADLGLSAGAPGSKPPYIAIGYLMFETLEQVMAGLAAGAGEVMADVPNYTNVKPILQISEVSL